MKKKERGRKSKAGRSPSRPPRKKHQGPTTGEALYATVDKNKKGFAFLVFDDTGYEDLFIPPGEARGWLNGDRVKVSHTKKGEVLHWHLVERRTKELLGRFQASEKGNGALFYANRKTEEVIPLAEPTQAKHGDWIRAKLEFSQSPRTPTNATVVEVLGTDIPATADIAWVASEHGLVEHHSRAAVAEAKGCVTPQEEPKDDKRIDRIAIPFITIDGETARDFDDAVFVEEKGKHWVLWVAIADVSHYVAVDSHIDEDAYRRATSVYFPERAFHMLPSELSENLCSLRPKEKRFALICRIELDASGEFKDIQIEKALIESRRRATYNEIQAEYEANKKNPKWEFQAHFKLYQILRQKRMRRGSLDFELPEAQIRVDDQGNPTSIETYPRLDAHRLIEEMMIAANEAVTEWALKRKLPFLYRIHESPSPDSILDFAKLAAAQGVALSKKDIGESPKKLSEFLNRIKGHASEALLNRSLLRSLKQAIYCHRHGIHFGLASEGYTHFTSPIRRYPDLIVHRLLKDALVNKKVDERKRSLKTQAEHCSYRERLATDAERMSHRIKQVRFARKFLGDEFECTVSGASQYGLYAQIASPYLEGFVPKETLPGDVYEFIEDQMALRGNRTRKSYVIGQKIKIRVVAAKLESRQIEFELIP